MLSILNFKIKSCHGSLVDIKEGSYSRRKANISRFECFQKFCNSAPGRPPGHLPRLPGHLPRPPGHLPRLPGPPGHLPGHQSPPTPRRGSHLWEKVAISRFRFTRLHVIYYMWTNGGVQRDPRGPLTKEWLGRRRLFKFRRGSVAIFLSCVRQSPTYWWSDETLKVCHK